MPTMIPAGPFEHCLSADGKKFPYYIVPFDKNGQCEAPLTRQHLLDHLPSHSDIFFFSHGWNNDWEVARKRYADFINGYIQQRTKWDLPVVNGYNPLLVGIFWPSQALAWFDDETGPRFAGEVHGGHEQIREIASLVPQAQCETFFTLAQTPQLTSEQARALAQILAKVLEDQQDEEGLQRKSPSADDLLIAAMSITPVPPNYDDVGDIVDVPPATPTVAGLLDALKTLDPRQLIKPFTVWQMKDRAGKVGNNGVSLLLADLLRQSTAKIHLLGHSYGCKVVMAATAALPADLRKIHSALLLQPAISQYAFANEIPESTLHGGYQINLERIERPILATFSRHDTSLSKAYHLALRRAHDLGEQPDHAGSPSRYGALGGFGPQPEQMSPIDIQDPPSAYNLGPGGRILGIQGSRTITGHGDISNASTWWLAYCLSSGPTA